jgi:hypothetical protein
MWFPPRSDRACVAEGLPARARELHHHGQHDHDRDLPVIMIMTTLAIMTSRSCSA